MRREPDGGCWEGAGHWVWRQGPHITRHRERGAGFSQNMVLKMDHFSFVWLHRLERIMLRALPRQSKCPNKEQCDPTPPGSLYSAQIMCFTLMHECVGTCSVVFNPVIPWNVVHQVPLSMEFPRQEYWSGVLFPTPGDLLYVQLLLFRKTHL